MAGGSAVIVAVLVVAVVSVAAGAVGGSVAVVVAVVVVGVVVAGVLVVAGAVSVLVAAGAAAASSDSVAIGAAGVSVAEGAADREVVAGAAGESASQCKSWNSSRLSSVAIRAMIQLCRAAYRKVDGCKESRPSLPTAFARMRAGSVRNSSIVLSYSLIIPPAVVLSPMWWCESRNYFSSRLRGQSQPLSWSRNALHNARNCRACT